MDPVLKWAGGKRQIIGKICELIPRDLLAGHTLYEPFVGGGSVFLALEHKNVVINDVNQELINVYEQIRSDPEKLILLLKRHSVLHNQKYYYEIRDLDRNLTRFVKMSPIEKAARTIYLNRTCFNGLYRVNGDGKFNVPIGSYKTPDIVREEQIRSISRYLNSANVTMRCGDFLNAVLDAKEGDVVYFDPPYDYDEDCKEGFSRYNPNHFMHKDLIRLRDTMMDLMSRGCYVFMSNNDTAFVNSIFDGRFEFVKFLGRRMINNTSEKRCGVNEVIVIGKP